MPHEEETLVGQDLVNVIHSHDVVDAFRQQLRLNGCALVLSHVLLVGGGVLSAEVFLDQKRHFVRYLAPCSEDSADVGRARYSDALEGAKLDLVEGLLDERAQVDLQVEPLVLHDHGGGDARVDVRPLYIVLGAAKHL